MAGASQASRLSSVPDAKATACCHRPAVAITPVLVRIAGSGWIMSPGVRPVAKSKTWKRAFASDGTVPARAPVTWYPE